MVDKKYIVHVSLVRFIFVKADNCVFVQHDLVMLILVTSGSSDGLLPGQLQAITWTSYSHQQDWHEYVILKYQWLYGEFLS